MDREKNSDASQTGRYSQSAANKTTDEKLLQLIRAYREKGHATGDTRPSKEQDDFAVALFDIIDTFVGFNPNGGSASPGRLAIKMGLSHRKEELWGEMRKRLLDGLKADGSYLAGWKEGGRSIPSFIWMIGESVAIEIGRQSVIDDILAQRGKSGKKGDGTAACDMEGENDEVSIRKEAKRKIQKYLAYIKANPGRKIPSDIDIHRIKWKSLADFQQSDGEKGSDAQPDKTPKNLIVSIETPLASALRVRPLLEKLRVVGEEMIDGKILLRGKEKPLTVNHKNIWFAFLALTPEEHEYLDDSIDKLAEKKGLSPSTGKRRLADCFVFFEAHRLFEECCNLLVSTRESRNMDDAQLAKARARAKMIASGTVPKYSGTQKEKESARVMFRNAIHQWIEKYT